MALKIGKKKKKKKRIRRSRAEGLLALEIWGLSRKQNNREGVRGESLKKKREMASKTHRARCKDVFSYRA